MLSSDTLKQPPARKLLLESDGIMYLQQMLDNSEDFADFLSLAKTAYSSVIVCATQRPPLYVGRYISVILQRTILFKPRTKKEKKKKKKKKKKRYLY